MHPKERAEEAFLQKRLLRQSAGLEVLSKELSISSLTLKHRFSKLQIPAREHDFSHPVASLTVRVELVSRVLVALGILNIRSVRIGVNIKHARHLVMVVRYQRRVRSVLRYLSAAIFQVIEITPITAMVSPHMIGE